MQYPNYKEDKIVNSNWFDGSSATVVRLNRKLVYALLKICRRRVLFVWTFISRFSCKHTRNIQNVYEVLSYSYVYEKVYEIQLILQ